MSQFMPDVDVGRNPAAKTPPFGKKLTLEPHCMMAEKDQNVWRWVAMGIVPAHLPHAR
jgi:hypothetical protein